jgi:hypothetical protein
MNNERKKVVFEFDESQESLNLVLPKLPESPAIKPREKVKREDLVLPKLPESPAIQKRNYGIGIVPDVTPEDYEKLHGEVKRHKYNIMPDLSPDEFQKLVLSIDKNNFDKENFPINATDSHTLLDGWHRWLACKQLGIVPYFNYNTEIKTDEQALDFVLKASTRRNLTPEQYAMIAVRATEMYKDIEALVAKEAKEAQLAGNNQYSEKSLTTSTSKAKKDKNKNTAKAKVAAKWNTTAPLIKAANKLNVENPKAADKVLTGESSLRKENAKLKKEAKAKEIKAEPVVNNKVKDYSTPDSAYKVPITIKGIGNLIRTARQEILRLEIDFAGGLLAADPVIKIKEIKYQLGHLLTKEL